MALLFPLNVPVFAKLPSNFISSPSATPNVIVPALATLPIAVNAPPVVVAPKLIAEPASIVKFPFIPLGPVLAAL